MKRAAPIVWSILIAAMLCVSVHAEPIRYSFDGSSFSGFTVQGPGFGALPLAQVGQGAVPADNAFQNATDGHGLIVQAAPGEGVLLLTDEISTERAAMIRCSIRVNNASAAVSVGSIGLSGGRFTSVNSAGDGAYFLNQYRRAAAFHSPAGGGFQALIQIVNTSASNPLTAYVDNLEIELFSPALYYSGAFLDGDETDPDPISAYPAPPYTLPLDLNEGEQAMEFTLIPAGTFLMGSPEDELGREDDEGPQHEVTLTEPFYLSRYEVTQAQWRAVMGYNPSSFQSGPDYPVERVSFSEAMEFINQLNQMGEGHFRLPTEAEWEYAYRAGSTTRFYWGEDVDSSAIAANAWYFDVSNRETHPVGLKTPNAFGIFDMAGNVWEWTMDIYGDYSADPQTDPMGPFTGSSRVVRGGGWGSDPSFCRAAVRSSVPVDIKSYILGLRLARDY
ncbi:MAG: SUMF1/EgtB/PvdO family nonheme iron enzyme [bacterium]|nr:SUMF1/EgtB/PvdO family nonheme iron enzyme [bacterium]